MQHVRTSLAPAAAQFLAQLRSATCATCGAPLRQCSNSVKFDGDADDVDDLLDRHLEKGPKRKDSPEAHSLIRTNHREALSLYRTIYRYTLLFDWPDDLGVLWRDKLRESARKEFEAAKEETDPEILTRLLITSREGVERVMLRFLEKRKELVDAGKLKPRSLANPYEGW